MSLRDVLGLFATYCVNVPFLKTTLRQNCLQKTSAVVGQPTPPWLLKINMASPLGLIR